MFRDRINLGKFGKEYSTRVLTECVNVKKDLKKPPWESGDENKEGGGHSVKLCLEFGREFIIAGNCGTRYKLGCSYPVCERLKTMWMRVRMGGSWEDFAEKFLSVILLGFPGPIVPSLACNGSILQGRDCEQTIGIPEETYTNNSHCTFSGDMVDKVCYFEKLRFSASSALENNRPNISCELMNKCQAVHMGFRFLYSKFSS